MRGTMLASTSRTRRARSDMPREPPVSAPEQIAIQARMLYSLQFFVNQREKNTISTARDHRLPPALRAGSRRLDVAQERVDVAAQPAGLLAKPAGGVEHRAGRDAGPLRSAVDAGDVAGDVLRRAR